MGIQKKTTPFKSFTHFTYRDEMFGRGNEYSSLKKVFASSRLILLYGPSGSGKSSLLTSKFIPEIAINYDVYRINLFNDDLTFEEELFSQLEIQAKGASREILNDFLKSTSNRDHFQKIKEEKSDELFLRLGSRIVLVFDQFEEFLISKSLSHYKESIPEIFEWLFQNGVNIFLCIREEYFSQLDMFDKRLPQFYSSKVKINTPSRPELVDIVERTFGKHNIKVKYINQVDHADWSFDILINHLIKNTQLNSNEAEDNSNGRISLPFIEFYLDKAFEKALIRQPNVKSTEEMIMTFRDDSLGDFNLGNIVNLFERELEKINTKVLREIKFESIYDNNSIVLRFLKQFINYSNLKRKIKFGLNAIEYLNDAGDHKERANLIPEESNDHWEKIKESLGIKSIGKNDFNTEDIIFCIIKYLLDKNLMRFDRNTLSLSHDSEALIINELKLPEEIYLRSLQTKCLTYFTVHSNSKSRLEYITKGEGLNFWSRVTKYPFALLIYYLSIFTNLFSTREILSGSIRYGKFIQNEIAKRRRLRTFWNLSLFLKSSKIILILGLLSVIAFMALTVLKYQSEVHKIETKYIDESNIKKANFHYRDALKYLYNAELALNNLETHKSQIVDLWYEGIKRYNSERIESNRIKITDSEKLGLRINALKAQTENSFLLSPFSRFHKRPEDSLHINFANIKHLEAYLDTINCLKINGQSIHFKVLPSTNDACPNNVVNKMHELELYSPSIISLKCRGGSVFFLKKDILEEYNSNFILRGTHPTFNTLPNERITFFDFDLDQDNIKETYSLVSGLGNELKILKNNKFFQTLKGSSSSIISSGFLLNTNKAEGIIYAYSVDVANNLNIWEILRHSDEIKNLSLKTKTSLKGDYNYNMVKSNGFLLIPGPTSIIKIRQDSLDDIVRTRLFSPEYLSSDKNNINRHYHSFLNHENRLYFIDKSGSNQKNLVGININILDGIDKSLDKKDYFLNIKKVNSTALGINEEMAISSDNGILFGSEFIPGRFTLCIKGPDDKFIYGTDSTLFSYNSNPKETSTGSKIDFNPSSVIRKVLFNSEAQLLIVATGSNLSLSRYKGNEFEAFITKSLLDREITDFDVIRDSNTDLLKIAIACANHIRIFEIDIKKLENGNDINIMREVPSLAVTGQIDNRIVSVLWGEKENELFTLDEDYNLIKWNINSFDKYFKNMIEME